MDELDPQDLEEVERVAREYSAAFRAADPQRAVNLSILPVVDCVDVGTRCGVYVMDQTEFEEHVREHKNENFHTDVKNIVIESLGKNAALARVQASISLQSGDSADVEWVEFLARTHDGWKVWANWLGPYPREL